MKKKIDKLNIIIEQAKKEKYEKERAEFIAEYEIYVPGGFLSLGYYRKDPILGEAKWNQYFPTGFDDWMKNRGHKLTSYGQQLVIDKINEIIDYLNKIRI